VSPHDAGREGGGLSTESRAAPDDPPPPPAGRSVLFVCTGNTCRSPLAEALCKRLLADRLGCDPGELEARGYAVQSAGIAAWPGDEASPPAVAIGPEFGIDLAAHRSRLVDAALLAAATDVIAVTHGHAAALALRFPGVGPTPVVLGGAADLDDPIGGDLDEYRACARAIRGHLDRYVSEWTGQT
jgi:protein-tyrosine-phosphatase